VHLSAGATGGTRNSRGEVPPVDAVEFLGCVSVAARILATDGEAKGVSVTADQLRTGVPMLANGSSSMMQPGGIRRQ
jgi:hypothetical protein